MSTQIPAISAGAGTHPIVMVVLSAADIPASISFYGQVFGWTGAMRITSEISSIMVAEGPMVTLRSKLGTAQQSIPFIGVSDVHAALDAIIAAGGAIEHKPWNIPGVGTMARFTDPSGTIYGLSGGIPPQMRARIPAPFGDNPKPAENTICSIEMHSSDHALTSRFVQQFGWSTLDTMPQYMMFDTGAGIGGVFQTHSPTLASLPYVYVSDVKAKLDAIEAAGGKRNGPAMSAPGMGTFGYFTDPSGTNVGLIGP